MPRPPIDLARKIKDILLHTEPLPDEARSPASITGGLGRTFGTLSATWIRRSPVQGCTGPSGTVISGSYTEWRWSTWWKRSSDS